MQPRRAAPMFFDVTALAVGRPLATSGRGAVAPASASASLRRITGSLHEPNAWTVGILLATGVVILARHPLARAIGTEVDTPAATVAPAPAYTHAPAAPAPAVDGLLPAVPTHAPRDPFRALVNQGGKVLAPVTIKSPSVPASPTQPAPQSAASGCTGTAHHVVAGDTLWTLAARAVHSADTGRVTIAWHRLYAANRDVVGSDPSLLRVGSTVCLPSAL